MIAPLFTLLGYDLADPQQCVPEFKADFGKTRGKEPVDWAFFQNSQPIFLVEAKDAGAKLGGHDEQLADYYGKYPEVKLKLGILTNRVMWRFFTDLIHENAMDKEPFVTWDVLNDDQPPYEFLKLLQKSQFKTELVRTFAKRQHDLNFLVNELDKLLEPSAEFTRLAIANIEKKRPLTSDVLESWKSLVVRAIGEWAKQRTLADVLNPPPAIKTVVTNLLPDQPTAGSSNLTAMQRRILLYLLDNPPASRSQLTEIATQRTGPTATMDGSQLGQRDPTVRNPLSLLGRGLVKEETVEVDGKTKHLFSLTDEGKVVAKALPS